MIFFFISFKYVSRLSVPMLILFIERFDYFIITQVIIKMIRLLCHVYLGLPGVHVYCPALLMFNDIYIRVRTVFCLRKITVKDSSTPS